MSAEVIHRSDPSIWEVKIIYVEGSVEMVLVARVECYRWALDIARTWAQAHQVNDVSINRL